MVLSQSLTEIRLCKNYGQIL